VTVRAAPGEDRLGSRSELQQQTCRHFAERHAGAIAAELVVPLAEAERRLRARKSSDLVDATDDASWQLDAISTTPQAGEPVQANPAVNDLPAAVGNVAGQPLATGAVAAGGPRGGRRNAHRFDDGPALSAANLAARGGRVTRRRHRTRRRPGWTGTASAVFPSSTGCW